MFYSRHFDSPDRRARDNHRMTFDPIESFKHAARRLLGHAVTRGEITRRPCCCCCCGDAFDVHAHHENYVWAYHVVWFCIACHFAYHARPTRKMKQAVRRALREQKSEADAAQARHDARMKRRAENAAKRPPKPLPPMPKREMIAIDDVEMKVYSREGR